MDLEEKIIYGVAGLAAVGITLITAGLIYLAATGKIDTDSSSSVGSENKDGHVGITYDGKMGIQMAPGVMYKFDGSGVGFGNGF